MFLCLVAGATHPQAKAIAPLEFAVAADLMSTLSEESVARTHVVNSTTTMSTTNTPSDNASVAASPFGTVNSIITSDATQARTKAVLTPSISMVSLGPTMSEERAAGAFHTTDTISTTLTTLSTSSHESVSVTPWLTVSFTLTLPAIPNYKSESSTVGGNPTTSATASVSFGDSVTVTFTDVSSTGTGQAQSISIINQPTQLTLTSPTTSATAGALTSSTASGGEQGARLVDSGLVAVVVCLAEALFLFLA